MNDFEIWQRELKKIDLTTAVAPVVRGVMLVEDNQIDAYNKIQKLLGCPELEASHRFLYSLDPTELTEAEQTKIANLYRLGLERGFISDQEDDEDSGSEEESSEKTDECGDGDADGYEGQGAAQPTPPISQSVPQENVGPTSAYTVLYSAMRDGQVKTGEAFSNSITTRSAKADVISKLERAGYQNITILAIEAGDPDAKESPNTYQKLPDTSIPDYSVSEDDYLDGRHHNFHVDEADDKKDDEKSDEEADDKDDGKSEEKAEKKDDKSEEKKTEDKPEKKEDVKEPDEKLKDEPEDKDDEESDDEDGEEDSGKEASGKKSDKKDELSTEQKGQLKDSYKKAFKAALQKCKFETSFSELSLEQKVDFFTVLSKAWGDKTDPSKFMTDKELEQLEKIVVNKTAE